MMAKGTEGALVLMLTLTACNNEKAQEQHDQAIAAAAALSAAAVQSEKDKATSVAAVSQAATQAAALQQQKDTIAKAKAGAELRADVQQHPDKYLQVSNAQAYNKGIINSYRQLTGVTVLISRRLPSRVCAGASTGRTHRARRLAPPLSRLPGQFQPVPR